MQKPLHGNTLESIGQKHMILPLPLFHNPAHPVKMDAVIHANRDDIMALSNLSDTLSKEIVERQSK